MLLVFGVSVEAAAGPVHRSGVIATTNIAIAASVISVGAVLSIATGASIVAAAAAAAAIVSVVAEIARRLANVLVIVLWVDFSIVA